MHTLSKVISELTEFSHEDLHTYDAFCVVSPSLASEADEEIECLRQDSSDLPRIIQLLDFTKSKMPSISRYSISFYIIMKQNTPKMTVTGDS